MDIGFCIVGDGVLGDGCQDQPPVPVVEERGDCSTWPPVGLGPLKNSWEATDVESDLKRVFIDLYYDFMRAGERRLNVYGSPHLGSFGLIERFVKEDGLAMIRKEDEDAMRYLFRAWKARNPKRGLHFLRTYLQMLWPNAWTAEQMWQDKSIAYPNGLVVESMAVSPATHFLTSRVVASVEDDDETGANLTQIAPALRATLGAKFLLFLTLLRRMSNTGDDGLFVYGGMLAQQLSEWFGSFLAMPYASEPYAYGAAIGGAHIYASGECVMGGPYPPP